MHQDPFPNPDGGEEPDGFVPPEDEDGPPPAATWTTPSRGTKAA